MKNHTHSWRLRWWQSLLGLLLVAGLGACSMPPPPSARMDEQSGAMEVAAAPAPVSRMAAPARDAKAASTLGTQWGEGRESVTKVVQASRLTPDRPRAVGQMRYSDEDSIRRALGPYAERQLNALLADGDVELAIGAGEGRPVYRIFTSRGAQDYHVAGRSGDRYELIYTNRSNRYYEVVATVDGLDVLSGKPGSVRSDGYLLRPGERLVIDGFRKNDREVAAFRFSSKDRAYANNTPAGDARNVGVIGTALFEVRLDERDPDLPRRPAPGADPRAFPADGGRFAPPPPRYSR
ncbi:hypothetical protein DZC30_01735 [Comamonas testosteroni]|uniref:Outer membrane lipoprotein n=1 Tax=Comamonas testosteroni TaxID=285 RepID=A0A373FQU0_COMTE|nr:hypothetical protein [Comamonas testosteroni]RGE46523.1 hypothetical protein DZC30_01735 [Comamonas testosteroni]